MRYLPILFVSHLTHQVLQSVDAFIQILYLHEENETKKDALSKLQMRKSDWASVKVIIYILSVRTSPLSDDYVRSLPLPLVSRSCAASVFIRRQPLPPLRHSRT